MGETWDERKPPELTHSGFSRMSMRDLDLAVARAEMRTGHRRRYVHDDTRDLHYVGDKLIGYKVKASATVRQHSQAYYVAKDELQNA